LSWANLSCGFGGLGIRVRYHFIANNHVWNLLCRPPKTQPDETPSPDAKPAKLLPNPNRLMA